METTLRVRRHSFVAATAPAALLIMLALLIVGLLCSNQVLAQYTQAWTNPDITPAEVQKAFVKKSVMDNNGHLITLTYNGNIAYVHKLTSEGDQVWVVTDVQGPDVSQPLGVQVDAMNNIYIAYANTTVVKYSTSGAHLWQKHLKSINSSFREAGDFLVKPNGDIFLTGTGVDAMGEHIQSYRLSSDFVEIWKRKYHAPEAKGVSIAFTTEGDVLVAGNGRNDFVAHTILIKYEEQTGNVLFEKFTDSKAFGFVEEILVGSDNSFYLINTSNQSEAEGRIYKFSSTGDFMWLQNLGVTWQYTIGFVPVYDAALDHNNNLVVLSRKHINRNLEEYYVTKFSAAGEKLWSHQYNTYQNLPNADFPAVRTDAFYVAALAINSRNEIAVTGGAATYIGDGAAIRGHDYQEPLYYKTMLLRANGETIWQSTRDRSEHNTRIGNEVIFDEDDRIYTWADANRRNFFILNYFIDPTGETHSPVTVRKYNPGTVCDIPVTARLYLPPYAMKVGEQVRTTADFRTYIPGGNHGVRWTWGDGSAPTVSYTAHGTSRITGQHRYQQAGIYTIGLDFSQSCLRNQNANYTQQMVIFDPAAGSVTGAGEFNIDWSFLPVMINFPGSTFSFSVQYPHAHALKPVGHTTFMLNGVTAFTSNSIDWLVVSEDRAAWYGTGSVDNRTGYSFLVTVHDGGGEGDNDRSDRMRAQIWDSRGRLVYDNEINSPQHKDLHQSLSGISKGQIRIHAAPKRLAVDLENGAVTADELQQLAAYPNPFQHKATLSFAAAKAGDYSVALYDLKGALVQQLPSVSAAAAGEVVTLEVDGTSLQNGVYFAKVVAADETKTVKLILNR